MVLSPQERWGRDHAADLDERTRRMGLELRMGMGLCCHGDDSDQADLCWDGEGVCHLTWASFHPHLPGIVTVPIDPTTGQMQGEPRQLWQGSGLAAVEAPHLYQIDGWWYLLLAEGGTERGHAVTIARARCLDGEWEPCPSNPILSHRSLSTPVQNTGHGDLIQLADGTWAMVYLGVRLRGKTPGFHTNGRETFLAGIDWIDGWPVVKEDRFSVAGVDHSFTERFPEGQLHPRWVSPGAAPQRLLTWNDGHLNIARALADPHPAILACRVPDQEWSATVRIRTSGSARFALRMDEAHWYGFELHDASVEAVVHIGPATTELCRVAREPGDSAVLRLRARTPQGDMFRPADQPDLIEMSVVLSDDTEQQLAEIDGRYLSTEVAGGFTGRVLALEVLDRSIEVESFTYRTEHSPARSGPPPADITDLMEH